MKFSAATLPLLALFAQQVVGVALPLSDDMTAELEARHHHQGQRSGFGGFGGQGNRNPPNRGGAPPAKGGNAGGAGAGGKGSTQSTSSAVIGTSTSVAAVSTTSAAVVASSSVAANNNKGTGGGADIGVGGNKGKGTGTTTTSSVAVGTTTSAAAAVSTTAFAPGSEGSNSGLSASQITALQTSLTVDKTQIQPGLAQNGQAVQEAGQVPSLTSNNNFVNFCATQSGVPLTNGLQIKTGSCNPTIIGRVLATDKIPTAKFTFPANMGTVAKNTTFTITMAINNIVTGNFVNANTNYYAAPCQTDGTGTVIGHTHFVVEPLTSLTQTTTTNPLQFAFFKGVNTAAVNGVVSATVTGGLNPGAYRLGSITTCSNHQAVLPSVAQRGLVDDAIYFTVQ